ncbi:MAG: LCP family protein [Clostridiales bacterium]|nr:LCP family protein [Clostridiales bacterium]
MKRIILKTLVLILVAALGFGTGIAAYIYGMMGNVEYVFTPFVDKEQYRPIEIDELDALDLEGDTDSSWQEGGHTKVYVHPDFPIKKVKQKDKEVENILVFGIDSRGSDDVVCRADAIMIVSFDQRSKSIKISSLMRDCAVNIDGRNTPDKLGHAYAYGGVGLLINTINDNFGMDISRFVMLDFHSSSRIIDAVGGIGIDVKGGEVKYANRTISEQNKLFGTDVPLLTHEGYQILTGPQAVGWARIRYLDSDFVRTGRQRTIATALMKKVSAMGSLDQLAVLEELAGMFETNMKSNDLMRIGVSGVGLVGTMNEYRVPADGMYYTQPSPWMMILDWEKQIPALHEFIWGDES